MTQGRFQNGNVPANKGKPRTLNEASKRNQFKPGDAAPNKRPIGSMRQHRGAWMRKVNEGADAAKQWDYEHRINWEAQHGRLPDGYILICLGDRSNPDASNWRAVPRAATMRINRRYPGGFSAAPAELKPLIINTALLEHAVIGAR